MSKPKPRRLGGYKYDTNLMASQYQSGWTIPQLVKHHGCAEGSVRSALVNRGLLIPEIDQVCDYRYFDNIDCDEKAYWVGFLYADGCVTDRGEIVVGLKNTDSEHLIKFKKAVKCRANVRFHKTNKKLGDYDGCSIRFKSPLMAKSLERFGIVPRKSSNPAKPCKICKYMVRHFMRGLIDGDGHVSSGGYFTIGLTGNKYVLGMFADCVFLVTGYRPAISKDKNSVTYSSKVCGKKASLFAEFLYENSYVYLDRKMEAWRKARTLFAETAKPSYTGLRNIWKHHSGKFVVEVISSGVRFRKFGISSIDEAVKIRDSIYGGLLNGQANDSCEV